MTALVGKGLRVRARCCQVLTAPSEDHCEDPGWGRQVLNLPLLLVWSGWFHQTQHPGPIDSHTP